ncbi:MAG: hypothetical protein ACTSRT_18345 [Promethearchaeota archaeon]
MIRARACIKCRVYIVIHPNNPLNQVKINTFEKLHHQHTLITINLDEIKDEYQSSLILFCFFFSLFLI